MSRIYASKTRHGALLGAVLCAASCASPRKPAPPSHQPPPPVVVLRDDPVTFRASEWLELHATLAVAARNEIEALPPAMAEARGLYAKLLADDDDDALFRATARAVADCESADCARAALGPFRGAFERAHTAFDWEERARWAWKGVERAHAAFDVEADGVVVSLAKTLGVTPGPVDIVAVSPPAGRSALLTPLLAARGPCFMQNTRTTDCVAVRALLAGKRPEGFSERFFTVLVVHAVAAVMTKLDPKHESVDRRSIAAVEPRLLAFITSEWRGGPVTPDLERRYRESAPDAPASR